MAKKENAFVWLLMKSDHYYPGLLASVSSFRFYDTTAKLVLMITEDVYKSLPKEKFRTLLELFDRIVQVPYITAKTKPLRTKKQQKIYTWIDDSFTKWNMLLLVDYAKVCFIDADVVTLKNIDEVFLEQTPAAVFKSSYEKLPDAYNDAQHGNIITPKQIRQGLKNGFVATAYMIVLTPSIQDHVNICEMIHTRQPYGHRGCFYGHDEQAISEYMSLYKKGPKANWTALSPQYGFNIGKYHMLKPGEQPYIIHYINHPKPWIMEDDYLDLDVWWFYAELAGLKRLKPEKNECYMCKYFPSDKHASTSNHSYTDHVEK